jgi:small-conductance mechanosensitive channel
MFPLSSQYRCSRMKTLGVLLFALLTAAGPLSVVAVKEPSPHPDLASAEGAKRVRYSVSQSVDDFAAHSTLAGSFKPVISKLLLTKEEVKLLWKALGATARWQDLVTILVVGWFIVPAFEIPYKMFPLNDDVPFRKTYTFLVADHIQQIAKIAFAVYVVDLLKMVCIGMGFEFCKMSAIPHAFAQSAYTLWTANRLSRLKKHAFRKYVNLHPETFGRIHIFNRLCDAGIYAFSLIILLNILQVEMGVAMSGFLALGSVGTLAVGLASKDLLSQILNGLMLNASARIYEGDSVKFGDGHSATIVKLGWMETVLRGSDEVMVSIPNTDLMNQRVSNLSRVRFCQVKQTLRFKYKDADKLPALLESIKEEIRESCPALITDGSRPFRAVWTDYGEDNLQVEVDAHFRIKPVGDDYWHNRQRVLQAINRAVRKAGLSFNVESA